MPAPLLRGARALRPAAVAGVLGLAGVAVALAGAHHGGARPPGTGRAGSVGAGGMVVSAGPGFDAAGLAGPVAPPRSCHTRRAADGMVLPDPRCTPGAVDAAVDRAGASATVCRPGWSARLRPPEALTEPDKRRALAAYGEGGPPSAYELDHLVPLELGGSSATANLWPEPDDRPRPGVANSKDPVEDALHALVCRGRRGRRPPLGLAQRLVAENWT
ncbi:MAG TPA: hypothetical protein VMB72_13560, partial [Acidimicrobiales bacterium]|nr:hypothetical protein [Acidimicrobiales bacterium]